MKNLKIALVLALIFFVSVAGVLYGKASSRDKIEYTMNTGPFHAVEASNGVQVFLTDCEKDKIMVRAENIERGNIKIDVVDGVLILGVKEKRFGKKYPGRKNIEIVVSNDVNHIVGAAGARFTAEHIEGQSAVIIDLTSGSVFTGNIAAESVSVNLGTGSLFDSDVKTGRFSMYQDTGTVSVVSGSAENAVLVSTTGSNSRWGELKIGILKADLSTGSSATVNADTISAGVSTGGLLNYKGAPEFTELEVSTAGRITRVK